MRRRLGTAAVGVLAALPLVLYLWHFMVDDALISARYAANLAAGHGYRFNVGGPVTDGVTPLGWAHLLAPFAGGGVWAAFTAAKWIGVCAWLTGAALVTLAIDSLDVGPRKWLAVLLMATLAPLGAWSAAGMETGLALGIAAASVSARALSKERWAVTLAGVVAALRPEAILWAVALALAPPRGRPLASRWLAFGVAAAPFVVVSLTRMFVFGRFAPLAVMAKPSSLRHGVMYALACLLLTGAVALVAYKGLPGWIRGLQVATLTHYLALVFVGGDWMPLARLSVVALPTLIVAASYILGHAGWRLGSARLALALCGTVYQLIAVGPKAAGVGPKRSSVIEQLRGPLQSATVVAALDVGWVGAATGARIVDLAGVTDPAVAVLPGGHTSKQIPLSLLDARRVDTLVLLLDGDSPVTTPWTNSRVARRVEGRVANMASMQHRFKPVAVSDGKLRYVVLRAVDTVR